MSEKKEKLVCNVCGLTYTDSASIQLAKRGERQWKELCKKDGVKVRGIAPCPNIGCKGELVLTDAS